MGQMSFDGFPTAEEAIDAAVWLKMLRMWLLQRLTDYILRARKTRTGRRGSHVPLARLAERLSRTDQRAADEAGMLQKEKQAALDAWVVCHVSVAEASQLRSLILASEGEGE